MKYKKMLSNLIAIVFVMLILGLFCSGYFQFIDFNGTFRLEFNGKIYQGDNNELILPKEGKVKIQVKGANGYEVEILPNVTEETDFMFYADDYSFPFSVHEFDSAFLSADDINSSCFYINCNKDYSLKTVLSEQYGGANIVLPDSVPTFPYKMVVTSSEGGKISIAFAQVVFATKIETDMKEIMFGV